jgi:ribosomal protein S18 acetylase RimI-like enzyme
MRALGHALKLDLEGVQRLDTEAWGDNAYSYMIFRQLLDIAGELFRVCKDSEDNVIAYGVIAPSVCRGSGWLLSLVVSSPYRRKGIGTALVNQLLDKATSSSLDQVYLTVAPDNYAAISFYKRLGFTPAANVERHYFGRDADRILMCRYRVYSTSVDAPGG